MDKILTWLNSGEYQTNIDQTKTSIMRGCASSQNEAETAHIFEQELYYLIRSKTNISISYQPEYPVEGLLHKFSGRGRLDAVINNLIIEYKHHTKLRTRDQFATACLQVTDYLQALYNNENIKYNAILTDGLKLSYFSFNGDNIEHTLLSDIEAKDIDLIIKAILFNSKKKCVPENILNDFSIYLTTDTLSKKIALSLYDIIVNRPTAKTNMLFEEWQNLMHLSVEDNGKSNDIKKRRDDLSLIFSDTIDSAGKEYKALYALQTTYAIIVKLIACKVVDKLGYNRMTENYYDLSRIPSTQLQMFFEKMEDGYSYVNNKIFNFLEGDFFSWYADRNQWTTDFWKILKEAIKLIDQYSSFSFNISYNPIDIFKDLYMSIIPKSIRHSMGEYFTPEWLADCVIKKALESIDNNNWKAIDPCCGSGIFIISLIKNLVGNINLYELSAEEKTNIQNNILTRVFGIDINPLSVLSARVGYYLALIPFGEMTNIEIPVYLGDSAIIPKKITIDNIPCYSYSITNIKEPFDVIFPERFVKSNNFVKTMNQLQSCVKTDNVEILYNVIKSTLSTEERSSQELSSALKKLSTNLVNLHINDWDGIWIRITTNFMLIARLEDFDLIVGNPPWVKWEHLPAAYASRIKRLCEIKHIFSNDGGQYGGTQLNICALISNVAATNWLKTNGILAFLMPDSIMSQNSYEEFRNFYIDYESNVRLYLQKIDRWLPPLRPFWCDDKPITQDFNTYYFSYNQIDYLDGFNVRTITRDKNIKDKSINKKTSFDQVSSSLLIGSSIAKQISPASSAFSYVSDKFEYSKIMGETAYKYRTGVEFTPQELYILIPKSPSTNNHWFFSNKKFPRSVYKINDEPTNGWELPTKYIYPLVTGPDLSPFHFNNGNNYGIIPYEENNTQEPISSQILINNYNNLFDYLISHQDLIEEQSEKSKGMHRGEEFYSLSKIGLYTFAENIVAVRDNSKFCAAVIDKTSTPWNEIKQTICVKHTIIISQDINDNFITNDEANYLCGILNSSIVISYMESSFKSNGYSLNKSGIYLPKYDNSNKIHKQISTLAKKAKSLNKDETEKIQEELSKLYLKICESK